MSTYPSIKIRQGLQRIATEHPTLDWQATSPGLDAATNKLNETVGAWLTNPAVSDRELRVAFKEYEKELVLAGRVQMGMEF